MALEIELLPMFTAVEGDYNTDDNVAVVEKDGPPNPVWTAGVCYRHWTARWVVSGGRTVHKGIGEKEVEGKVFQIAGEDFMCPLGEGLCPRVDTRADRYKLELALIVEGVISAPDNNVGIDEDTLALVDDLELFFHTPGPNWYRRLLKGFWVTCARKMSDAKTKNEKDVSYTIHGFSIVMQIWAYEIMPKLGERFDERTSTKQPQQRTYVRCALQGRTAARARHTASHGGLALVPFLDRPVQFLDDLARSVVGPQFHVVAPTSGGHKGSTAGDGHDDESGAGAKDDETSASDDRQTLEGNGDNGSKADDSGGSGRDASKETGAGDIDDDEDASG
ncbi:Hypothetical predicted protein [Olea europaea subsp. europaea]|uniref:Uncharacterized protein n=1 Tax=Olea europaea subsp. europaea TaxID=158383 RepID=A0A8S0VMM2_OLEEU|nr:Hypothetical predicted protein [Olea europaea subsp. europaea]